MVAHLLTVLLVKVVTQKNLLKYNKTKVIALDRDLASAKKADEISKKFENRFIFRNKKV